MKCKDYVESQQFSQQPPKQDNNEFGHSGDKTVSSYPEDNQQPPKERKVSLEEIFNIIDNMVHGYSKTWKTKVAQAILSLINATEERKGE